MAEGGATILVVEDEPLLRFTIRHYLERNGFTVCEAANVEGALDRLRRHPIQLLLVNLVLPDGDGSELSLLAGVIRPSLPILCMSAYPKQWSGALRRTPGGNPILEKPFTEAELLDHVRQCLSSRVR